MTWHSRDMELRLRRILQVPDDMPEKAWSPVAFFPDAMLPGWIVTDRDLNIRHWNHVIVRMAQALQVNDKLARGVLSIRSDAPATDSFWQRAFEQDSLIDIQRGVRVIEAMRAALIQAESEVGALTVRDLVTRVRSVLSDSANVKSYLFEPDLELADVSGSPVHLKLGVKISPPQGLTLRRPIVLEEEGIQYRYVEILAACRVVMTIRRGSRKGQEFIDDILFAGVQPALHDATARHQLWVQALEAGTKEYTSLLSHGFKNPAATAKRDVKTLLHIPTLGIEARSRRLRRIHEIVTDLTNLAELIIFINSRVGIETIAHPAPDAPDTEEHLFTLNSIQKAVSGSLLSVYNGRTEMPTDRIKLTSLLAGMGRPEPDEAGPDHVERFEELARKLIYLDRLPQDFRFRLSVSQRVTDQFRNALKKTYTTLFDLVLPELVVNAIKAADESGPRIGLTIRLDEQNQRIRILVYNNGDHLPREAIEEGGYDFSSRPGDPRTPLGIILNKRVTALLGVGFKWLEPPPGLSTCLALDLPLSGATT